MAGNPGAIGRRFHTQFTLRLPDDLHARVVAAASANGRSLNTEIAQLLEAALPAGSTPGPDGAPGKNLRDWIAVTMPLDAESPSVTQAKALMGEPLPDHNVWAERPLEAIRWHATAEAKLRFLRADAMLAARAEGGAE